MTDESGKLQVGQEISMEIECGKCGHIKSKATLRCVGIDQYIPEITDYGCDCPAVSNIQETIQ